MQLKDREIWFDTVEKVFKIYESKNDDNVYKWERTRAAWYGGSVTDVEFPQVNFNSQAWLLVGVIAWVSNAAKNGQFNPTSDLPMQSYHIVPMNGTYFIRDETSLYVFNQQKRYTHDGGSLKVGVYYQSNDGTITNKLLETIYDSKSNYTSYNDAKKEYRNATVEVKTGDIIYTKISIVRNKDNNHKMYPDGGHNEMNNVPSYFTYQFFIQEDEDMAIQRDNCVVLTTPEYIITYVKEEN